VLSFTAVSRLGALLLQFPYSFHNTEENQAYIQKLADQFKEYPLVLEIRHTSWDRASVYQFLREIHMGFCNLDQPQVSYSIGPTKKVTSKIGYLRLHGRNVKDWFRENAGRDARYDYRYDEFELFEITERIRQISSEASEAYVITNNHYHGKAVCNALEIKGKLGEKGLKVPEVLLEHYPSLRTFSRRRKKQPILEQNFLTKFSLPPSILPSFLPDSLPAYFLANKGLTLPPERVRILRADKSYGEKMATKNQGSESMSSHLVKTVSPEERKRATKRTLLDMKQKLLTEGLGKSLPEDLVPSFDIGDEGDRADKERTHEVSILLSARDREKLLAIEEALEKIEEGTYGVCEDCGDEIGSGRLKAMPLAKLCVTCQSRNEKEIARQRLAGERSTQPLIYEMEEEETY